MGCIYSILYVLWEASRALALIELLEIALDLQLLTLQNIQYPLEFNKCIQVLLRKRKTCRLFSLSSA